MHLIGIAADGIYLTVMYDYPVRMSSLPAWICIGTETRMYRSYRSLIIRTVQIIKEGSKLSNKEHPLVDNCSAR